MKKLTASSIAEVVIAITIIAVCFVVAARVFIQSNQSGFQFDDVFEQTRLQEHLFRSFKKDSIPSVFESQSPQITVEQVEVVSKENNIFTTKLMRGNRLIWEQDYYQSVEEK